MILNKVGKKKKTTPFESVTEHASKQIIETIKTQTTKMACEISHKVRKLKNK